MEMDSKVAFELISLKCPEDHPCADIVTDIVEIASSDCDISFHLIFREANRSADCLARLGHGVHEVVFDFSSIPPSLGSLLRDDVASVSFPRLV